MELFAAVQTRSSAGPPGGAGPVPSNSSGCCRRRRARRIMDASGPGASSFSRRHARAFTAAAAEAKRARAAGDMTMEQLAAEREKMSRSPTIVVVGCAVNREQTKIPEIEQVVAAGAAAQNLFLAAHDLGYGVMWKTGAARPMTPPSRRRWASSPTTTSWPSCILGARLK